MPPDMAIDMRHSTLKPEEAALLAGELNKPSWESKNEGIHERVSFEDSIWGFDLAGGSYYKTPLRVVGVKANSRAEKAGIRPGDRLKRINDIDTSTLTIQEAHTIIIESGVHLKIAVTAPEDEEDAYFCYQDPLDTGYDSEEERRKEKERQRKREVHAKVSSYWSLQWPWVSKRRVIYRESNCFMVPSKFEEKHSDRFTKQSTIKTQDDIVLQSTQSEKDIINVTDNKITENVTENPIVNGNNTKSNAKESAVENEEKPAVANNENQNDIIEENDNLIVKSHNGIENNSIENMENEYKDTENIEVNEDADVIPEVEEECIQEEITESVTEEISQEISKEEEILNEILGETSIDESISKAEEDNVLNSILSDSDEQILGNSNENDER